MRHLTRFPSEFETLEIAVQNAGSALACAFSSSAEFEAATIAAKRAAGIYGPKRQRRHALFIAAGIALLALLIALLP
jgi:hypothetical protein